MYISHYSDSSRQLSGRDGSYTRPLWFIIPMRIILITLLVLIQNISNAQSNIPLQKQVLEQFVNDQSENRDTLYLRYGLNNNLKTFLTENLLPPEEDVNFHDLRRCLSESDIKNLLSEKSVNFLVAQLRSPTEEIIYGLDFKSDNIRFSPIQKVKLNIAEALPLNNGIPYLIVSEPIITENKEHILLSWAYGTEDSMIGGIRLFEKKNNSYFSKCDLNPWIE